MTDRYDILIVGGGMVGLTLACRLCHTDFRVGVIESKQPAPVESSMSRRVSAINRASINVFQSIGIWEDVLATRVSPFREMHVWDSTGAGAIHFDSADLGQDTLGYIVENNVIQNALLARLKEADNISWLCPGKVESIILAEDLNNHRHQVVLEHDEVLECRLLVGADGAASLVRKYAGIGVYHSSYQQKAIVCTVQTEHSHQETAWQCFLPTGPLAFLPLGDGSSSIVWSLDESRAGSILSLDDEAFKYQLEQAYQYQLGAITSVGERLAFPLGHSHVESYVQNGLALIGDAAHTIHPLAGQGANLGFLDAASLANVVLQAHELKRQWFADHTLRKYERDRKGENRMMETIMTGFKFLFGNESPLLSTLRNSGLGLADNMPLIKYQLMRHAMGLDKVA